MNTKDVNRIIKKIINKISNRQEGINFKELSRSSLPYIVVVVVQFLQINIQKNFLLVMKIYFYLLLFILLFIIYYLIIY